MSYPIINNYTKTDYKYLPSYAVGKLHFYYCNSVALFDDADFANWEFALFDCFGNKVEDLGAPTKDIITGSDYRWYIEFEITENVSGEHYFVVYNTSTDAIVFQSNKVRIITQEEISKYAFVQFRHTENLDNYNYALSSYDTKYNSLYLDLNAIEDKYEHEIDGFTEENTAQYRRQKNQRRRVIVWESLNFDNEAHAMMTSISDHDQIFINGEAVTTKTPYSKEEAKERPFTMGTWEVYVNADVVINING